MPDGLGTVGVSDENVGSFIRYLSARGIRLVPDERHSWRVDPKPGEGFDILVVFRTFPPDVSEADILREISQVNLALRLNARARLAMSYPSVRGPLPPGTRLDDISARRELIEAFDDYKPGGEAR